MLLLPQKGLKHFNFHTNIRNTEFAIISVIVRQ